MSASAGRTTKWLATSAALVACLTAPSTVSAAAEPRAHFATGGVSHVSGTSAELEGSVNTEGLQTSYYFEYGPTVAYGIKSKQVTVPIPAPLKPVKVGETVSGLLPGYHYRIVGFYTRNGVVTGPLFGTDKSFTGGQAGKLKFVVAKGREEAVSIPYGSLLSLSASLSGFGNAAKPLSLQATPYPYTAPFTTLGGSVLSSRTGSFTFKVAKVMQNTEFRYVELGPRPLYSHVFIVHVTPRITLHVRSAGKTGLYRIYGTVAPARIGAGLAVQQLVPQKAGSKRSGPRAHPVATTVLKHESSTLSRFSTIVKLSGTYHYRVFVRLPKGSIESGSSADVLIRAPRAGSKKAVKA